MKKNKFINRNDRVPYCQSPALGLGAPECSEDCYKFGNCYNDKYFRFIAEKNGHVDKDTQCDVKCAIQSSGINLNNRFYSMEELSKIVTKYEDEKKKKKNTCDRCGNKYSENHFNMCDYDLHEIPNSPGYAHGYQSPPHIKGIQIKSTCGNGKEIKLCDDCIVELIRWIKIRSTKPRPTWNEYLKSQTPSRCEGLPCAPGSRVLLINNETKEFKVENFDPINTSIDWDVAYTYGDDIISENNSGYVLRNLLSQLGWFK